MKKKNLKLLSLNKKAISNLSLDTGSIVGGGSFWPCPVDSDFPPCLTIDHCTSMNELCHSQATTGCWTISYCNSTQPLCPPTYSE